MIPIQIDARTLMAAGDAAIAAWEDTGAGICRSNGALAAGIARAVLDSLGVAYETVWIEDGQVTRRFEKWSNPTPAKEPLA
jgi:hypothetical protein